MRKAERNEMYTTNAASKDLPTTYIQRRAECEGLLEIAKKIESIVTSNTSFQDDLTFEKLEKEYKEKFMCLHSLSL